MSQSDADVLKEFLIDLGFQVDERGFKKFTDVLSLSGKLVDTLAVGAFTAAAAVTAFAAKMTENQSKLYYANQLAGESAENFNAFSFAAQKVGLSVDQAGGAVRAFGLALQTKPEAGAFLEMLGIDPTQDPIKVFQEYIDRASALPKVQVSAADSMLGLPDDLVFQLVHNRDQFTAAMGEYQKNLKDLGLNLDDVQKKAAEINASWVDIQKNLGLAGDAFFAKIVAPLQQLLDHIDRITGNAISPPPAPQTAPVDQQGLDWLTNQVIHQGERGAPGQASPRGALGLMQIMPETGRMVAKELNIDFDADRLKNDPDYNKLIGRRYLQDLMQQFNGDTTLTLAAYNAGPGAVNDWLNRFGDPRDPKGTINYDDWVAKIPYDETRRYLERTLRYKGTPEDDAYNRRFLGNGGQQPSYTAPAALPPLQQPLLPDTYLGAGTANHAQPAGNDVTVNQTFNIRVNGGNGSPTDIAGAISNEFKSRQFGDAMRNAVNTPR